MRAATRLASFSRSVLRVGFEPRLLDGPPSQFGASGAIAAAVGARSEALLGLRKLSISAWAPLGLAKAAVQQPGSVLAVLEGRSLRLAVARGFQSGMGSFADAAAARPSTRIAVGEQVPQGVQYKVIGRLELGKPYQVVAKDLFAVVEVGPHQFKVTTDDLIYVEKLGDVDINDKARQPNRRPHPISILCKQCGPLRERASGFLGGIQRLCWLSYSLLFLRRSFSARCLCSERRRRPR